MSEDLTEHEVSCLDDNQCPDCGYVGRFLIGPSGGMSTNIRCPVCEAGFNVVLGLRGDFGKERIGRPDPAKLAAARVSATESCPPVRRLPEHIINAMRPMFAGTTIMGLALESLDRDSLMASVIIVGRAQPVRST